jgi:hypothetical protein
MPRVGEVPRKHASRKTRPVTRPVKGRLPDQEFVATIGSGHLPVGPLQTVTVGPARVDIPNPAIFDDIWAGLDKRLNARV